MTAWATVCTSSPVGTGEDRRVAALNAALELVTTAGHVELNPFAGFDESPIRRVGDEDQTAGNRASLCAQIDEAFAGMSA